jgi:hypothetical protein
VEITGVTTLLQADGTPYPSREESKRGNGVVPDLETIRLDPQNGSIWYGSEGDVGLSLDPFIRRAAPGGA